MPKRPPPDDGQPGSGRGSGQDSRPHAEVYDLSTRRGRSNQRQANRAARLARKAKRQAAAKQADEPPTKRIRKPRCKGTTTLGRRCRAAAQRNGFCIMHSPEKQKHLELMAEAKRVHSQFKRSPHELMRTVIESNPLAFMQPYLDALGIRVVFVPDAENPDIFHPTAIVDPNSAGAVLYGVSKDGDVVISKHKDVEAQQRAAERLFDRVYGKPKQTNILASAASSNDPQLVPFDDKRQAEIAAILEAAKSPSHAMPPNSQN